MNWEQVLANIVPVITIVGGMIAWLRNDINRTLGQHAKRMDNIESEIKGLKETLTSEVRRLDERITTESKNWHTALAAESQRNQDLIISESRRQDELREAEMEKLREEMREGFIALEDRMRGVETEQARVAGLLEGLALTGRLPDPS